MFFLGKRENKVPRWRLAPVFSRHWNNIVWTHAISRDINWLWGSGCSFVVRALWLADNSSSLWMPSQAQTRTIEGFLMPPLRHHPLPSKVCPTSLHKLRSWHQMSVTATPIYPPPWQIPLHLLYEVSTQRLEVLSNKLRGRGGIASLSLHSI